jgi:hypothetical protein
LLDVPHGQFALGSGQSHIFKQSSLPGFTSQTPQLKIFTGKIIQGLNIILPTWLGVRPTPMSNGKSIITGHFQRTNDVTVQFINTVLVLHVCTM